MKNFIQIALLVFSCSACSAIASKEQSDVTYIQLGLIHNYHLDPDFHYPASTLISIIDAVKPDMICGEAVAKQWQSGLAGLFPFENRVLEYAGKRYGATFVPVDWRTTYAEAKEIMEVIKKYLPPEFVIAANLEREKLETNFEETLLTKNKNENFFYYVHTRFLTDSGLYHAATEKFYGDVPYGFWYRRNLNIFNNCRAEAERLHAKKVLVAYGAEHQYILDSLFKLLPRARSVGVLNVVKVQDIDLKPTKLPLELKEIFLADQKKLRLYVNSLPENSDERKELATKRIPGLEKILNFLF